MENDIQERKDDIFPINVSSTDSTQICELNIDRSTTHSLPFSYFRLLKNSKPKDNEACKTKEKVEKKVTSIAQSNLISIFKEICPCDIVNVDNRRW